ncbi:heme exporter protein CcmD [Eoetvoesiella caeni]|uniref:Heme exporter protein D n=2 Tax=Eoetvoesiella caeni TaxID=645616 RepID=A0A366H3H8_9BURK|nr:heme exporter protein CcmD [Eoetvoesiella caeni]RBP36512.1 heme exporter protein D [Eoetvoesiella caeni]
MNWTSPGEFFAMGGYSTYVWGSVLVSAAALCAEWFFLRGRRKAALSHVKRELTLRKEHSDETST